jgi:catechol 2,3-dioxygenase-like lactoylglutathione lyase family enzyme
MPIREFFHLLHMVDDFDAAEARFDAVLAPQTYRSKHWSDFDKRWASLSVIGPDFVVELAEAGHAEADLGSPLPKFYARHGQHLHSFAWFVDPDDLDPLIQRMRGRGVHVLDPYPAVPADDGGVPRAHTIFTYPKDTFGQLEFQSRAMLGMRHHDPRATPEWTGGFWRDEHPLGIERTSHMTTVVADLDRARAFYEEVLDAPAFHAETNDERRSAFVKVGDEAVIELAEPRSTGSRLEHDLAEHGELPHGVTFKVADLDAAERHVDKAGVRVAERSRDTLTLEPADMCNAVIAFTTRSLPGDPRA